jgi:hypothetical protein
MDQFTRAQLRELAYVFGDPAVSLYMPTFRAGREMRQNSIRFKNLLKQTAAQLSERGLSEDETRQLLAEATSLETNDYWWQHQSDGLAVFLSAERFTYYRIPLALEERVSVGRRFYVRPMLPLLEDDGRFHVLVVSQNRVRLLEGTHYSVSELDPSGLPGDLRSALNIDEYADSLQQHSTGMAEGSQGTFHFHGHGSSDKDVRKKDELLPFLRRVDAALARYVDNDHVPLVFAGVDYLFPLFQQTCTHKGLAHEAISGSASTLSPEKLHEHAWRIVEPIFRRCRDTAWNRYQELATTELASDELVDVIRAAATGQVDVLFVANGAEQWGVVDEQVGAVSLVPSPGENAEELLNYAEVQTLTHGGAVFSLPRDCFPVDTAATAILRYPLHSRARAENQLG